MLSRQTPLVSVVMPVYNAAAFLQAAIDSILQQTLSDFEFILLDDGSTDASYAIMRSYADPRIRLVQNEVNIGVTQTMNKAVQMAKGRCIARMDADDIAVPERLALQVAAMEEWNADVLGGAMQLLGGARSGAVLSYPQSPEAVALAMVLQSPVGHPTMMAKASVLKQHPYQSELAEDYELLSRLVLAGYRIYNLPVVLVHYRITPTQLTAVGGNKVPDVAGAIAARYAAAHFGAAPELITRVRTGNARPADVLQFFKWLRAQCLQSALPPDFLQQQVLRTIHLVRLQHPVLLLRAWPLLGRSLTAIHFRLVLRNWLVSRAAPVLRWWYNIRRLPVPAS